MSVKLDVEWIRKWEKFFNGSYIFCWRSGSWHYFDKKTTLVNVYLIHDIQMWMAMYLHQVEYRAHPRKDLPASLFRFGFNRYTTQPCLVAHINLHNLINSIRVINEVAALKVTLSIFHLDLISSLCAHDELMHRQAVWPWNKRPIQLTDRSRWKSVIRTTRSNDRLKRVYDCVSS